MLRPALIPAPGKSFVVADWSAIEGRVNPWLAASAFGEAKLDVFRRKLDPYKVNAAATYSVAYEEVTGEQRQVGKVQELACGFGGSVGAFNAMGRIYGVVLPEAQSRRMVEAWRRANPWAVEQWSALERAYTIAMRQPGHEFTAGRVTYLYDRQHLWYALPSGRVLCYPHARFERDGITYAKAAWKPAQDAKEWPRARLWHGLACENIVQAVANDLLRDALRRLDAAGQKVVLHVHDEIVLEADDVEAAAAQLEAVMVAPPAWAAGLPLAAEVNIRERYGK
jgi:DNA polymerase